MAALHESVSTSSPPARSQACARGWSGVWRSGGLGKRSSKMAKRMGGAVVVVTGASSGVGRACARAFGARGARVGLIARNAEALEHAADEIRQAGGEALVLPLDVADAEAMERAA